MGAGERRLLGGAKVRGRQRGIAQGLDGVEVVFLVKGEEGVCLVPEMDGLAAGGGRAIVGLGDECLGDVAEKLAEGFFTGGGGCWVRHDVRNMAAGVAASKRIFHEI